MFYVEDDHDAIISKRIWECVQLEIKRRKKYLRSMGQTTIPTGRKAIHLHPRLFAETAIRYLHEKAGGAARVLTVRYGSAVNATRSKESWDVPTATWRKKR